MDKRTELTQEQVNAYIAGDGAHCPFCGSDQIEGSSFDTDAGCVRQDIDCKACDATWTDSYHLAAVIDEAGNVWDDTRGK